MIKVLVAGGTGFVGSAIVRHILDKTPHEVRVLSRDLKKMRGRFPHPRVEGFEANITDRASLSGCLHGIDSVIQCVQFPNHPVENPRKGFTYEKVDAQGTENLCEEISGSTIRRLIYVSGAGTSPERRQSWFRAKMRAEHAIRSTGKEFVILRPSWIYGPEDNSLNKLIKAAERLPFMPIIGNGKSRVAPLFIEDFAEVCVRSLNSVAAKNRIIELGGPQNLTMNQIAEKVLKAIGKNKPLIHQSQTLMKIGASLISFLSNPPLSPAAIDFITMDIPVNPKPAEEIFGLKFMDLETALSTYKKKAPAHKAEAR